MVGEKLPRDFLFKTHDGEALIRCQASKTHKEGDF
jgi:hypothetical protein